jgi:hypothetical protein
MTEHLALTDRASSDERSGLGVHASVRLGRVSQMLVGDSDAGGVTRGAEIFCGVGPDPAVDAKLGWVAWATVSCIARSWRDRVPVSHRACVA